MAAMKPKIFPVLLGLSILVCGCVETVSGRKTTGMPFVKDTIEARYERPVEQVCQAAKEVIQRNGVLNYEGTDYGLTNAVDNIARVIEGRVNQRRVWVRVYQL